MYKQINKMHSKLMNKQWTVSVVSNCLSATIYSQVRILNQIISNLFLFITDSMLSSLLEYTAL